MILVVVMILVAVILLTMIVVVVGFAVVVAFLGTETGRGLSAHRSFFGAFRGGRFGRAFAVRCLVRHRDMRLADDFEFAFEDRGAVAGGLDAPVCLRLPASADDTEASPRERLGEERRRRLRRCSSSCSSSRWASASASSRA